MKRRDKKKIILEFDCKCQICGKEKTSDLLLHHIVPLGLRGADKKGNLILLCQQCHSKLHGLYKAKAQEEIYEQNPNFFEDCIKELGFEKGE